MSQAFSDNDAFFSATENRKHLSEIFRGKVCNRNMCARACAQIYVYKGTIKLGKEVTRILELYRYSMK